MGMGKGDTSALATRRPRSLNRGRRLSATISWQHSQTEDKNSAPYSETLLHCFGWHLQRCHMLNPTLRGLSHLAGSFAHRPKGPARNNGWQRKQHKP
jgi:hypothetical protein